MKNPLLFTGMLFFLYSCSSTNLMSLSVNVPAPVTVPPAAHSAAVVNRSGDDNNAVDRLHRVLSLETRNLQAEGARASMTGLADELIKDGRFAIVRRLDSLDLRSYGAGVFPTYLSWDTVEKICRDTHSDVLFSLEMFDAESKVNVGAVPGLLANPIAAVAVLEQPFGVNTRVKTGWRIYDPSTRNILDEFVLYKDLDFQGRVGNPVRAANSLLGRQEAVRQAGIEAGQSYASRIVPYSIRVSRFYFVRGDRNFILAKRMAQSGDWDGAARIWLQEAQSSSHKAAGRACYNMAIISEINGDLNGAVTWSTKAYEVYNVRLALSYLNLLHGRQNDDAVLKNQTELTGP